MQVIMYHIQVDSRNTGKCVRMSVLLRFEAGRHLNEVNVTLTKNSADYTVLSVKKKENYSKRCKNCFLASI